MKAYFRLTKLGIGIFVVISGLAGYAVSFPIGQPLEFFQPILLIFGLYLVSAGSFALNQAQEWQQDTKMPRTAKRPVPAGELQLWQAYAVGVILTVFGLAALLLLNQLAALLALTTVLLYNGLYTLYWKKRWAFGAVPGAVPGAMPVVIGYAVNSNQLFSLDCVYLFLIMFLWQMPHFWALAIRFRDDYARGGFPVLPTRLGVERTLYHVGLYTFAYVGVALAAPLFIATHIMYVFLIMPLALKVLWEFFKYYKAQGEKNWLPFFLWINLSMLIFICVPVFDKWVYYLINIA
jgi:protoheme IX farnesyltransferase